MQSSTPRRDHVHKPLGERRGKNNLARSSIDLVWAREASDSARSRAYPSPPMSGSPPNPPRPNFDSFDRGHGSYGSSGQDVFRGLHTPQMEPLDGRVAPMQEYPTHAAPPAPSHSNPYRAEEIRGQPHNYPQLPQLPPQQPAHPNYSLHNVQSSTSFAPSSRPQIREALPVISPKQHRKTKGHVASACVPCKKAHLRCDSQRPCNRCIGNGKEALCVDVQHKKRGRPRLRDERDGRYEGMSPSYPSLQHEATSGRPLSAAFAQSEGTSYAPLLQRSSSHRVSKTHGGGQYLSTRHLERASMSDANIYSTGQSLPPPPRMLPSQEPPCAYLMMDMQFVKATTSFAEAIGFPTNISGNMVEFLHPVDREKLIQMQRILEDERRNREGSYIPQTYLVKFEQERMIQSVGFGPAELGPVRMDRLETLSFQPADGQQRSFRVRFGLGKQNTTFYIVAQLDVPTTPQSYRAPGSSPYSRESHSRESQPQSQYGYQAPLHGYGQNPGSSSFMGNPGFGDSRGDPRGEMSSFRYSGPIRPSAPLSANAAPYSQPQARAEYPPRQAPYQAPRMDMQMQMPQQRQDSQSQTQIHRQDMLPQPHRQDLQPQSQRQDMVQLPPIIDPNSGVGSCSTPR